MRKVILVTLIAIGIGTLVAGVAFMYILMQGGRNGFSARDRPSAVEAMMARAMRRVSIPQRSRNLKNPVATSSEVIAAGRAHWADHCALCHGNDGSGDTDIGRNVYPKAPDMRAQATQGLTDGELYFVIENGVRLTAMPGWGEARDDDEDSWKLVAFIRHLPALTVDEKREMEQLNPKAPDDSEGRDEQQQDDDFLRGREAPAPVPHAERPQHRHH